MADDRPGGAFYERRWFKGTAAVVALVVSTAALVGVLSGVIGDVFSSHLPRVETEIVFDTGETMNATYQGSTKLDFAQSDLAHYVVPFSQEGIALRTFGGSCGEKGNLAVDFGAN